jgi:glycosyltransferase involved in cell wall biosynthesis
MSKTRRIGLYTTDFNWAGGIDFIYYIYTGLKNDPTAHNEVVLLFASEYTPPSLCKRIHDFFIFCKRVLLLRINFRLPFEHFPKYKPKSKTGSYVDTSTLDQYKLIFEGEPVKMVHYVYTNAGLNQVLYNEKIDILLPVFNASILRKELAIPFIGYIFDFTHKYNTHLYSPQHCLESDMIFASSLLYADVILANSQAVKNDIQKFFPYQQKEVFKLPFTPFVNQQLAEFAIENQSEVLEKFSITRPFFIVCNQMWPHKNHELAIRALAELYAIDSASNIDLVFTGSNLDLSKTDRKYRELQELVIVLGLEGKVHFLGHIDRVDQLKLILQSIALIQPTTFEGGPGGGAVYIALALNKPCLVSNIPINLEIEGFEQVRFFDPSSAAELADLMKTAHEIPFPSAVLHQQKYQSQLRLLGTRIGETIDYVLAAQATQQ